MRDQTDSLGCLNVTMRATFLFCVAVCLLFVEVPVPDAVRGRHGIVAAPHWAFIPPEPVPVPAVDHADWVRNPIDHFILRALEKAGLEPSPAADKTTIARRLAFDLTGLPPTVDEIDRFLADTRPEAYDELVDRLLAAPAYGERMAQEWLDAARFADTNGYHIDNHRDMWKWRDWVVDAFNANQPFDQFTIEQLAGDMLPNATVEQRIASGFNRNVMVNFEGGAIPEEYLTKYVGDRVTTTATVWMGLTLGCAECHDHKFDPITQREYYQFYAFFHNVPEKGLDGSRTNPVPSIPVPSPEDMRRIVVFDERIAALETDLIEPNEELDSAQLAWEEEFRARPPVRWQILKPVELASTGGSTLTVREDDSVLVSGENPARDVYTLDVDTDLDAIGVLELEALVDPALPQGGPGRHPERGVFTLTGVEVAAAPRDGSGAPIVLPIVAAMASYSEKSYEALKAVDGNPQSGWSVRRTDGDDRTSFKARFFLGDPIGYPGGTRLTIKLRHESDRAREVLGCFRLAVTNDRAFYDRNAPPKLSNWFAIGPFESKLDGDDGSFKEEFGPEVDLKNGELDLKKSYPVRDGATAQLRWQERQEWKDGIAYDFTGDLLGVGNTAVYLTRELATTDDRSVTLFFGSNDGIRVWLNDQEILNNNASRGVQADEDRVDTTLRPGSNTLLVKISNLGNRSGFYFRSMAAAGRATPEDVEEIVRSRSAASRSDEQRAKVRDHFRTNVSEPGRELVAQIAKFKEERKTARDALPTTMVMQEMEKPRETFVLVRGDYRLKGEKVRAGVPAFLPPLPTGTTADRLTLAKWLIDPSHPLTGRVTVNRFWQQFFGIGLVATSEDFGVQGEAPSHPELLDWLARALIDTEWDVKKMLKLIVTSSTYRQSSRVTPELYERDPQNRLLARGPKQRLAAEMIRDSALAMGGLLDRRVGGESVRPYQPEGLWKQISIGGRFSSQYYVRSEGDDQYRRGLYVYWKRSLPYPSMVTFDAPSREVCVVRRPVTNTPLQALVLMNDPVYVEAARVFAQRILLEGGDTAQERVRFAFRTCLARPPSADEERLLLGVYSEQSARFAQDVEAARELTEVGDADMPEQLSVAEVAAWTTLANVLFNLDETITKR